MSFFDKLRKGVTNIETEVKKLKELTEDGEQLSDEQLRDNLMKAKRFDSDVRQTYVEVTQLLNDIKSSGNLLIESKDKILSIKQKLCDIEDNSGLKKFGYKPFGEQYSIESMDDNVFLEDIIDTEVVDKQNNFNVKALNEEFTKTVVLKEEMTTQSVRFAPDMPIVSKRINSNERTKDETKPIESKNQMVSKKYEKLLTRTPQPQDFGCNTRRYTFLPQIYNNNKYDAKDTPEEPLFESTQTYRFTYLNNNGLNSGVSQLTPPNMSSNNNNADSFVTVEFTPGLTTKRPKGISRVNQKPNYNKTVNDYNKVNNYKPKEESTKSHRLPQSILQSVENDKITPEQPIIVTNSSKSANILRSIAGKSSGTPPLPKSRVDANLHNQILKHL